MLKENGYQENISNSHHLHQSQQQSQATDIQEEEIRISINLLCVVYTPISQNKIHFLH